MKVCVITAATNTIPRFRIDMIDEFVRRGCEVVVFGNEPHERWDNFFGEHGVSYRTYSVSRNGMNPSLRRSPIRSGLTRLSRTSTAAWPLMSSA